MVLSGPQSKAATGIQYQQEGRSHSAHASWIVELAGHVIFKCIVMLDGSAGYERATGHRVGHKVCRFGEYVLSKLATDEADCNNFEGE